MKHKAKKAKPGLYNARIKSIKPVPGGVRVNLHASPVVTKEEDEADQRLMEKNLHHTARYGVPFRDYYGVRGDVLTAQERFDTLTNAYLEGLRNLVSSIERQLKVRV